MNYIYDILINLNEKAYDFYDWNMDDGIEHIRKIPIFKIESKKLFCFKNNDIIIEHIFLDKIKNKTEIFSANIIEYGQYICLLSDGLEVIAVEFNSQGKVIARSKLLIDEENEVLEVANRLSETTILFNEIIKDIMTEFKTRKELKILKFVNNELHKLKNENPEKIRYLYYECFNKKEIDVNMIINKLDDAINNNWKDVYQVIYNFFKLTSVNK